jgi:hypothetical protein
MRIAPRFLGRRLPPVEQVDAVGLEEVEAVAMALVGVNDGAAATQAPIAEVHNVSKQAGRPVHRHGDEAAPIAGKAARNLQQHRNVLTALAVVGVGEILFACDLALIRENRARRFVDVRAEQSPETLAAAAMQEQGGASKFRGGRMQQISVARRRAQHGFRPEPTRHQVVGHAVVGRVRTDAKPRRGDIRSDSRAENAAGQQRGEKQFLHEEPRSSVVWSGDCRSGISSSSSSELRHFPWASSARERVTPPASARSITKFSAPRPGNS